MEQPSRAHPKSSLVLRAMQGLVPGPVLGPVLGLVLGPVLRLELQSTP